MHPQLSATCCLSNDECWVPPCELSANTTDGKFCRNILLSVGQRLKSSAHRAGFEKSSLGLRAIISATPGSSRLCNTSNRH